jgi:hypothetical protein
MTTDDEFVALPPLDVDTFIAGLDSPNHSMDYALRDDMLRTAFGSPATPQAERECRFMGASPHDANRSAVCTVHRGGRYRGNERCDRATTREFGS